MYGYTLAGSNPVISVRCFLGIFADECQRLCRDNLFVFEVSEGHFAAMRKVGLDVGRDVPA